MGLVKAFMGVSLQYIVPLFNKEVTTLIRSAARPCPETLSQRNTGVARNLCWGLTTEAPRIEIETLKASREKSVPLPNRLGSRGASSGPPEG